MPDHPLLTSPRTVFLELRPEQPEEKEVLARPVGVEPHDMIARRRITL